MWISVPNALFFQQSPKTTAQFPEELLTKEGLLMPKAG